MSGPDPLARAGRALRYWETRQQALSHNLANVNTAGFKGERVFARMMESAGGTEGPEGLDGVIRGGDSRTESSTDLSAGNLTQTGRPYDLAIEGDGFFRVQTEEGFRLTRNGSFQVRDGFLTDAMGNQVQGEGGSISIPEGTLTISQSGEILVDESSIGRIEIVRPGSPERMTRGAGGQFDPGEQGTERLDDSEISIRQGALEESNVNPVDALVEMLEIQRRYSSVERSIRVLDDITSTATTRLGRLR